MKNNQEKSFLRFEELKKAGIDVDEAMEILCGNVEVFEFVLQSFLKDKNFEKTVLAIQQENYHDAFLYAHALKGVLANLGMKQMHCTCSQLVEKLRNNDFANLNTLIMDLQKEYTIVCNAIQQ